MGPLRPVVVSLAVRSVQWDKHNGLPFPKSEKETRNSSLILEKKPNFPGEADEILEKIASFGEKFGIFYFILKKKELEHAE